MSEDKAHDSRALLDAIEEDWDASRPRLPVPAISAPNLDDLDTAWDEGEDEEDEDDVELPDERLDPVAYAAAKKALEERREAKKRRRRDKREAKRAKQKDRTDLARQKQKTKKPRTKTTKAPSPKQKAQTTGRERGHLAEVARRTELSQETSAEARPRVDLGRSTLFTRNNAAMLAVAIAVLLAAAIFAAVMAR